jgi:hypothetical protein
MVAPTTLTYPQVWILSCKGALECVNIDIYLFEMFPYTG